MSYFGLYTAEQKSSTFPLFGRFRVPSPLAFLAQSTKSDVYVAKVRVCSAGGKCGDVPTDVLMSFMFDYVCCVRLRHHNHRWNLSISPVVVL